MQQNNDDHDGHDDDHDDHDDYDDHNVYDDDHDERVSVSFYSRSDCEDRFQLYLDKTFNKTVGITNWIIIRILISCDAPFQIATQIDSRELHISHKKHCMN